MKVGILIITHGQIGESLYNTVMSMIGTPPLVTRIISVTNECKPEQVLEQAKQIIGEINSDAGVLVLTDLYGSTPSNIACALKNKNVEVVTGINLPMLVRIMNYPSLSLDQLQLKAISGGHEGVFSCAQVEHYASAKS